VPERGRESGHPEQQVTSVVRLNARPTDVFDRFGRVFLREIALIIGTAE
jgi:hypothetical protein